MALPEAGTPLLFPRACAPGLARDSGVSPPTGFGSGRISQDPWGLIPGGGAGLTWGPQRTGGSMEAGRPLLGLAWSWGPPFPQHHLAGSSCGWTVPRLWMDCAEGALGPGPALHDAAMGVLTSLGGRRRGRRKLSPFEAPSATVPSGWTPGEERGGSTRLVLEKRSD